MSVSVYSRRYGWEEVGPKSRISFSNAHLFLLMHKLTRTRRCAWHSPLGGSLLHSPQDRALGGHRQRASVEGEEQTRAHAHVRQGHRRVPGPHPGLGVGTERLLSTGAAQRRVDAGHLHAQRTGFRVHRCWNVSHRKVNTKNSSS